MSSRPTRVVFNIERDTYHTTEDVVCKYEVLETLEADSWDYIGIFPVGWQSQNAYKTYEYVSLPEGYEKGTNAKCVTTFPSRNLPKDEEHYYQFCYISRKHKICGASGPFQFRSSLDNEFVEQESDGMMFIRPRVEVMQEEIQNLGHKVMVLSTERDSLQQTVENSQKIMELRDQLISKLQAEVRTLGEADEEEKERNRQLCKQMEDLKAKLKACQEAQMEAEETLSEEEGKIAELQRQIEQLQSNIRAMQIEKDELSGQNQSLVTELDTYKLQVADSQTMVAQSQKTINKMNDKLAAAMHECTVVVEECEQLKKRNRVNEDRLGHMDEILAKALKEKEVTEHKLRDLADELQNANDKLQACDTMKMKLSSDLDAYEVTQLKMNSKFENQESELRSMKERLEKKAKDCVDLQKALAAKTAELSEKSEKLTRSEANLNHTLMTIQEQNEIQKSSASKYTEVESHVTEMRKQLALVSSQLKAVNDEKMALQMQLQGFEEELQQTLSLKDKEVAELTKMLKEKEQRVILKDEELTDFADRLAASEELYHKTKEDAVIMAGEMKATSETMKGLQKRVDSLLQEMSYLKEERDQSLERCMEMEMELDQLRYKFQQEEDAYFCLRTAHEALVSRVEDKDRELSKLNQEAKELNAELVAQFHMTKEQDKELIELKQRLELGKKEYTKEAAENWKLNRLLKKEVAQVEKRAADGGSVCSSNSDASDEETAEKYRQLYKHIKKQKQELRATLKEKEKMLEAAKGKCQDHAEEIEELKDALRKSRELVLSRDSEICRLTERIGQLEQKSEEEAEEEDTDAEQEARSTELIYGNPYGATLPQANHEIIRSTLEEEQAEDDALTAAAGEDHQLPPPLEPEVVSAPGAAASSDSHLEEVPAEEGAHDIWVDCVPPADERFLDAIGEGMKICPFCEMSIMASSDFEEHVVTHFGRICPICRSQADDSMSLEGFQQHVNRCLDKESAATKTQEDVD